ncbi:MAG: S53 family peptidase [Candidatus Binataceae bacterium]
MEKRRDRVGIRHAALSCCVIVVLTVYGGIVMAQDVPIVGDHVNAVTFSSELPGSQPLQLEVIMALNNRAQLTQLEADVQNRDSPSYHRWLTPQQFAASFGPTTQQLQAVIAWLRNRGLIVTATDPLTRAVRFTGLYWQVKKALGTTIRGDGVNYANVTDPQVPAELAPTIVSIEGLRTHSGEAAQTESDAIVSSCTEPAGCNTGPYFGPGDLYTFYDETSVLTGGNLGTSGTATSGDCIALPENASINPVALTNFVNQFKGLPSPLPSPGALPPIVYTVVNPPVAGAAPTATPGLPSDNEPYLDIEWAHAVSPKTPIRVYYVNGDYLNAMQYAVLQNQCGVISSSVEGPCDPVTTILALDDVEAEASLQGQTIFKSSGDYGSNWKCGSPIPAELTQSSPDQQAYNQSSCPTSNNYADANGNLWQPSIDEEAASANITVVGGTKFQPIYDSAGNDLSTVGDGLESVWNNNDSGTSPIYCPLKDASGGGTSVIFGKPAWQTGIGVPNDGARDIPDVAMGADGPAVGVTPAIALPGFFVATQKTTDPAPTFALTGGTSIATPMWAGVSRLVAQAQGVTRLGNINSRLYELGNLQSPSSGLHDVTTGNNANNSIPGYSAGVGYDLVTGWGSPDIAKLVAAFPGAAASTTPVNTTVRGGKTAAPGTLTITNTTSGILSLQSVTINLSSPSLFSSLTLSGTVGTNTTQVAAAVPSASSVFTFSPLVSIPSSGSATLVLRGLTVVKAPRRGSDSRRIRTSSIAVAQGGVDVGDGQGGIIEVSGLPATLGSVRVRF